MPLLAGTAEVVITPPVGTFLEGYGARTTGSVGVHDELYARAIVIDDGVTRVAIVSCDLIGIDRHTTAAVRALVAERTVIPAEHVLVAATHTHAGPVGMHRHDDSPLRDVTNRLIAGAIEEASHSMRPAVLKAGGGSIDSVSQNRRDPEGPIDDGLWVLLFDSPSHADAPVAGIMNFACHSTVLYHTNMAISADYPGFATAVVRDVTGSARPLFLNGACGDVNPSWIEQDYAEAERVGSIVGAEAARRMLELRPLGHSHRTWNIRWDELTPKPVEGGTLIEPRIRVANKQARVRLRALPPVDDYVDRLRLLEEQRAGLGPTDVQKRHKVMEQITRLRGERGVAAQLRGPSELAVEVQALSFGPGCALLALPGEFFVETARAIRTESNIPHLLIACYANHHVMYVVPSHEFERGGYEPGVSILDEHAEAEFRSVALEVLREVMG